MFTQNVSCDIVTNFCPDNSVYPERHIFLKTDKWPSTYLPRTTRLHPWQQLTSHYSACPRVSCCKECCLSVLRDLLCHPLITYASQSVGWSLGSNQVKTWNMSFWPCELAEKLQPCSEGLCMVCGPLTPRLLGLWSSNICNHYKAFSWIFFLVRITCILLTFVFLYNLHLFFFFLCFWVFFFFVVVVDIKNFPF